MCLSRSASNLVSCTKNPFSNPRTSGLAAEYQKTLPVGLHIYEWVMVKIAICNAIKLVNDGRWTWPLFAVVAAILRKQCANVYNVIKNGIRCVLSIQLPLTTSHIYKMKNVVSFSAFTLEQCARYNIWLRNGDLLIYNLDVCVCIDPYLRTRVCVYLDFGSLPSRGELYFNH